MNEEHAPEYSWQVNGLQQNHIAIDDRSIQYGDGLFETMRICHGRIPLWARHLERLAQGCERLKIPLSQNLLSKLLDQYLAYLGTQNAAQNQLTLKIIVSRGVGPRGYGAPQKPVPTIALRAYPYRVPHEHATSSGVKTRLCTTQLACNPALAGIKHLNRLEQVLARTEWYDDSIYEGLMTDVNGYLVEGTMTNLFYVKQRTLYTPDLSQCGVKGVMRGELIDFFSQAGLSTVVESRSNFMQLADASEVFITNSVIGALAVTHCEHLRWQPGEFQHLAHAHISDVFNNKLRIDKAASR